MSLPTVLLHCLLLLPDSQRIIMITPLFVPAKTQLSHPLGVGKVKVELETLEVTFYVLNSQVYVAYDQKTYTVAPQCRIQPIYDSSGQLKEIKLIKGPNSCKVEADKYLMGALYDKLRLYISHEGFNEYFRPLKRLGRGSFATVYLVECRRLHKTMAAKVFSREGQALEPCGKESLLNEIKIIRMVQHPNLLRCEGVYQTDSLVYLVTEYIEGGTLDSLLVKKCLHSGEFILNVFRCLLTGLQYLVERGIMHRDLKPENVLFRSETNEWVISDFGLAAFSEENYLYGYCGTQGYVAPQIKKCSAENLRYTASCDIYSFGVIAYQLMVGCLPFKIEYVDFFQTRLVSRSCEGPQFEGLPQEAQQFLKKILEPNPKARLTPASALSSRLLNDPQTISVIKDYFKARQDQRYNRILQLASINQ